MDTIKAHPETKTALPVDLCMIRGLASSPFLLKISVASAQTVLQTTQWTPWPFYIYSIRDFHVEEFHQVSM